MTTVAETTVAEVVQTEKQAAGRRDAYVRLAGVRQWNRVMRVVRRVHLYSGLFLFPWVMLYGVTALLFNHQGAFPDVSLKPIPVAAVGSPLHGLPSAADTAADVVAALRQQHPDRFSDAAIASGSEPFYPFESFVTAKDSRADYNLSINMGDGSGVLRTTPKRPPEEVGPFAGGVRADAPNAIVDRVTAGARELLTKEGVSDSNITFRGPPDLYFQVAAQGQVWPVKFNAVTQTVNPVNPLSWRGYFLRLHTSHHYPHQMGARWLWAVAVDAMFVAMVFWGVSGLFMWWQIKAVRWLGLVTVLLGAATAIGLGIAMHGVMIN